MKKLIILLLLPILIFGCATTQHGLRLTEVAEKVTPSVVLIVMYDENGIPISQGTGFFVSEDGNVITNYHVLMGAKSGAIKTGDGGVYQIKDIIKHDTIADLALLSIDLPKNVVRLPTNAAYPEVGETIAVIGNPLGLEKTLTVGHVSAIQEFAGLGVYIQFDAPISPGSSGSPVVNMKGEVIGIVTSTVPEGQNLNFAIPYEKVANLLQYKQQSVSKLKYKSSEELGDSLWRLKLEKYAECVSLLEQRNYDSALSCFEEKIKKNPNDWFIYWVIGICNDELGFEEEANSALEKGIILLNYEIKNNPDNCELYQMLPDIYFDIGRTLDKENALIELISCYNREIKENPYRCRIYKKIASIYWRLRQEDKRNKAYEDAILCYRRRILSNSNDYDAYLEMAKTYDENLFNDEEAIKAYRQAIKIDPFNPKNYEAYYHLGVNLSLLKKYDEAIKALESAIRIGPSDYRAYHQIGTIYFRFDNYTEAVEFFKKAIKLHPKSDKPECLWLYYELAKIYRWVGQKNEEIETYKQIVLIEPEDAVHHYFLGEVYSEYKYYELAIKEFEEAIRLDHNYSSAYYKLGWIYSDLEQMNQSVKYFKEAIRLNPDDIRVYTSLGIAYLNFERNHEAVEILKTATQMDSSDAINHYFLGRAYYNLNRYHEAVKAMKKAIRLVPDDAEAYFWLGLCYVQLGKNNSALEQYNKLKTLDKKMSYALKERLRKSGIWKQKLKKYPYDFRKVKWGMNKEQVKRTEEIPICSEDWSKIDNAYILYYEGYVSHKDCVIMYMFEKKKLRRARYVFSLEYSNANESFVDYTNFKNELSKKYGEPDVEDAEVWNDSTFKYNPDKWGYAVSIHHLIMFSSWETVTTVIDIMLIGSEHTITIQIEYEDKKYKQKVPLDEF